MRIVSKRRKIEKLYQIVEINWLIINKLLSKLNSKLNQLLRKKGLSKKWNPLKL